MHDSPQSTGCCPPFVPEPWDGAFLEWQDKKFVKGRVFTFLYVPINFGSIITRMIKKVESAEASMPDWLCLSDHTSRWNMDLYLAVDKDVPGLESTTISGKFLSKVYEGDFRETGNWCKDFDSYAKGKGLKTSKLYMWYTTCPKCAKTYGKNYVVVIGRVE